MGQIVGVVFPLFAIIGLGKLAVRFRFLDSEGAAVLSRFAFLLLVPALLFAVMAEGPTADVFGQGGVYFAGCLLMYCLALCLARWLKEPSWPHGAAFVFHFFQQPDDQNRIVNARDCAQKTAGNPDFLAGSGIHYQDLGPCCAAEHPFVVLDIEDRRIKGEMPVSQMLEGCRKRRRRHEPLLS